MGIAGTVLLCVGIFAYIELAIFTGCYMYMKAAGQEIKTETKEQQEDRKNMIRYSVAAGVVFPITFAILAAHKAAERK
nr:MAG TPA: Cytochrome oxidase c assembly [Caudoviricetes sp.]